MAEPEFVHIVPQSLEAYRALLVDGDGFEGMDQAAAMAKRIYAGRAIWHVNSTLSGGGVSEILRSLLPYARGAGVDVRWVVLREIPEFFELTKRIHNNLHGNPGDGGELGEGEHRLYEETLAESASRLGDLVRPDDVIFLHDPQTAGLVPLMAAAGARVVWRCHIGVDHPNELVRRAWRFLSPYVEEADAYVFSRPEYIWDSLDQARTRVMAPSIDPFLSKNQDLSPDVVEAILWSIGLGDKETSVVPVFTRADGTPGRVERHAELFEVATLPADVKLVAQISRWDELKDHPGVLECFSRYLDDPDIHLALVGPSDGSVSDDPEGAAVLADVIEAWRQLPDSKRRRAHIVILPMDDLEENGAMVNAIQRRADVLVQKSVAEGFGLTVSEGMWKERPVAASRLGGIQDQIVDGESGVLIDDPHDLESFGRAIRDLLDNPERARKMGQAARIRVMTGFLGVYRLRGYVELLAALDSTGEKAG